MAEEQKPAAEPQKNRTRWTTKAMRWAVGIALTGGTGYGVKKFVEDKPLYDTFETKEAAARKDEAIRDLKKLAENYQNLTIKNTAALTALTDRLDERHRDAQAIHRSLQEAINNHAVDIATLQFILKVKSN